MKVIVWGNRGSIPVPGQQTVKFGGNTPCLEVQGNRNSTLIFDAGSGIRLLGNKIAEESRQQEINVFITHKHWDHIQGLPFFRPLYLEGCKINLYAPATSIEEVKNIISVQMLPKYFPVGEEVFNAEINYIPITENEKIKIDNLLIESIHTHHSKETFAYKINEGEKSVIYMTDNELYFDVDADEPNIESVEKLNADLVEFCKNTELLIHDTMYSPEDYKLRRNWGHSCSTTVAYFAALAKVRQLMFFHYEPDYNDEMISELCRKTSDLVHSLDKNIKCMPSKQNLEILI